jgi:hypothetical protein
VQRGRRKIKIIGVPPEAGNSTTGGKVRKFFILVGIAGWLVKGFRFGS